MRIYKGGTTMSRSIKKSVGHSVAGILVLFVMISFAVSFGCARLIGKKYQDSAANAALDFAEMSINADKAKESVTTRIKSDDYDTVQRKIADYQKRNSDVIKRISLVSFSNSAGNYIYDSDGEALGKRIEYESYTLSIKAELINGRNPLRHTENQELTVYRPIRTVDDNLCGYIIVELNKPYEYDYFHYIAAIFAGMFVLSIAFSLFLIYRLDRKLFKPIKQITDSAVYLSGDDSVFDGKQAKIKFDTKRKDEVGRLSSALQKIFFDMNSGAEHLSQALYDANHDGMTQHLNKRCYHSMIETFRQSDSICVIYFDVNNLKLMNDTLGHENGDRVIKRGADYIRGLMKEGDYCFRMGGDEFLMVMTDCSFRDANRIIEKLDKDSPYLLSRDEDEVKCALSYGFAFGKGDYSYDDLLAEAEENMYSKKAELKDILNMPDR